jgi:nucleoside-diphosphate-sugar epimerase
VAVTGASGYIGSFVAAELLSRGYDVRAPVRGSAPTPPTTAHRRALPGPGRLAVFDGGDLSREGSFDKAFEGCAAVIHTAAEVALSADQSVVDASVEGTRNVLASVDRAPEVRRFVQTSSVAAIQRYDMPEDHVFDERDWNTWSSMENGDAYGVAKTRAEELVHAHFRGGGRRAAAVNPGVVIGPVMTKAHTKASAVFLRDAIFGNEVMNFPATFVDVRDVAKAHVNAMERLGEGGAEEGARYILVNGEKCLREGGVALGPIAERLFPGHAFRPKPRYPEMAMRILRPLSALPVVGGMIMTEVQRKAQCTPIEFSNARATEELGVDFRSLDTTVKEGVESIVELGFAKMKRK